jgi:uncharacterized OsmC-like protein
MTTTSVTQTTNGIDVGRLNGLVDAVDADPGLARTTFRTKTRWRQGFTSQTEIGDYVHAGTPVDRDRYFYLQNDHPVGLLGRDTAPAPFETLMAALASSIASSWAVFGAAMDIPIDSLEIWLQGEVDLQGLLGPDEAVRPGLARITGTIYVRSPSSDERLHRLKETAERRSPIADSIQAPIELELVRG